MAKVEAQQAAVEAASLLVVDDEPAVLKVTQKLLERRGYRVIACHTAEQALAWLEREAFDVVLSDVQMPGIGGLGLLRAVREREAELPVILVTGNPNPETECTAFEQGAFQYLTKPVAPARLNEVVSDAADSSRRSRRRLLARRPT
jgi:DNA-binding NtrC family response regulator